jgi:hypothetical protein
LRGVLWPDDLQNVLWDEDANDYSLRTPAPKIPCNISSFNPSQIRLATTSVLESGCKVSS